MKCQDASGAEGPFTGQPYEPQKNRPQSAVL